ncbi:hypothetical protein Dalu01_01384 [Deinococcus aluminii]|uniref:Uncharacterized protein n=2 Tax=Deinococcus aluminii TaxID=1656885 RepID=A0ABP9XCB4_9DEIO
MQALKQVRLPTRNLKPSTAALVQVLDFSDADAFAQARERVYEYEKLISARPAELEIKLDDDVLRLMPYSSNPFGRSKITELHVGETARYEWNERIVLEHTWRYGHTILNIGLTLRPLHNRLFYKQPDYHESNLVQMY